MLLLAAFLAANLADTPPATDEQREEFLRSAEATNARPAGGGVTGAMRVTLRLGRVTADAHVQTIDVSGSVARDILHLEAAFTDSYRYNIAAYLLDRLLGFGMTPVAVEREFRGKPASYSWWMEGTQTEAQRFLGRKTPPDKVDWERQMVRVRLFDFLISNTDRNKSNLLIDKKWKVWMIDHSRAFRTRAMSPFPAGADPCDAALRAAVLAVTPEAIHPLLAPWLRPEQIDAILQRRQVFLDACPSAQSK
jgi:hypothetical protein